MTMLRPSLILATLVALPLMVSGAAPPPGLSGDRDLDRGRGHRRRRDDDPASSRS